MERWTHFGVAVATVLAAACGSSPDRSAEGQASPPPTGETSPPPIVFGTPGPWPVENAVYGAGDGILEFPVVGVTTDEAQNRWVATRDALYLLRPGDTRFRRLDAADGLHLGGNAVRYCDDHPIGPADPCRGELSTGAGLAITKIVGGGRDEVFVGYLGIDETPGVKCLPKDTTKPPTEGYGDYCDPNRHTGKIDRVRVRAEGEVTVDRFDLVSNRVGGEYWHDRTIQSFAFDHFAHPHTLYAGTNHGVTMLLPDHFRLPRPDEWYDLAYVEWMGDHLHARICAGGPCGADEGAQRMGDWAGVDVDAKGDLWHAGRWTAGLITWVPDPGDWFGRNGAAFAQAFGDPYPLAPNAEGFTNEPVFKVAVEGDSVHLTGVAVCPDGRIWFSSSGPQSGTGDTVAVWKGRSFDTFAATRLGLGEAAVRDIACLPDGRIALAGTHSGVVLYDPGTDTSKPLGGLPSGTILDLEVDRMVVPPALHVATDAGAAVLRVLP